MTVITQAVTYLVPIFLLILAVLVLWIALARTRRDLTQLSNDLARIAASQQQSAQPPGDELGKVRENIEQLLDVLEERSTVAEHQLRQLIEEAREAAKQIDEATAIAVKVLDAAASPKAAIAPSFPEPAVEQRQSVAQEVEKEPIPRRWEAPEEVEQIPLPVPETPEMAQVTVQETVAPPEPVLSPVVAANEPRSLSQAASAEDSLLEPLAREPELASPTEQKAAAEVAAVLPTIEDEAQDPLSAWAPYKPAARAVEGPAEEGPAKTQPAEAVTDGHFEAEEIIDAVGHKEAEPFEEPDEVGELNDLAGAEEEQTDFQPYAIKPADASTNASDNGLIDHAPEPVIFAAPIQAHVYASELNNEENEIGHSNGELRAEDVMPSAIHAEDALGAQNADPYSAVYTLAELGVTDVSEIARRTGLGQTEVEMVLNLWRRH